ncbi:hypothetical protein BHM03_00039105 [Ensete ventricosum]|nr:hypothetical protein BHM03_00039105 [Ensete ventricosum]
MHLSHLGARAMPRANHEPELCILPLTSPNYALGKSRARATPQASNEPKLCISATHMPELCTSVSYEPELCTSATYELELCTLVTHEPKLRLVQVMSSSYASRPRARATPRASHEPELCTSATHEPNLRLGAQPVQKPSRSARLVQKPSSSGWLVQKSGSSARPKLSCARQSRTRAVVLGNPELEQQCSATFVQDPSTDPEKEEPDARSQADPNQAVLTLRPRHKIPQQKGRRKMLQEVYLDHVIFFIGTPWLLMPYGLGAYAGWLCYHFLFLMFHVVTYYGKCEYCTSFACFNAFDKTADIDVLNHPILNFTFYLVCLKFVWS